jgi:hypothetical protein
VNWIGGIVDKVLGIALLLIGRKFKNDADPKLKLAKNKEEADRIVARHDGDGANAFLEQRLRPPATTSGDTSRQGGSASGARPDAPGDK